MRVHWREVFIKPILDNNIAYGMYGTYFKCRFKPSQFEVGACHSFGSILCGVGGFRKEAINTI